QAATAGRRAAVDHCLVGGQVDAVVVGLVLPALVMAGVDGRLVGGTVGLGVAAEVEQGVLAALAHDDPVDEVLAVGLRVRVAAQRTAGDQRDRPGVVDGVVLLVDQLRTIVRRGVVGQRGGRATVA